MDDVSLLGWASCNDNIVCSVGSFFALQHSLVVIGASLSEPHINGTSVRE